MKNTLIISLLLLATFESFGQSYTYIPDTAFEQALINQGYDDVLDGRILTSAAATVTRLVMPNQNPKITDITGIEAFINLEYFDAIDNSIVVLDFTKNTKLQEIRCWHNTPTERTVEMLDVTGLTDLTYVGLDNNLIRVGDFSTNSALEIVGIQNNELTSLKFHPNANLSFLRLADNDMITHLDLANNDTNLNTFRAVNNPNLSCIRVSDLNNAETNSGWDEDSTSVYGTTACPEADYTVIPDSGFEQFLIDSSWDSGSPDGRVLTANLNFTGRNNTITINEAVYNINELTGIQDFTDELEAVNIQNQPLNTTPYLGPKTNINSLVFKQNPSLGHVSFLPYSNLTTLELENNGITSLAVTEFTLLISLQVWENLNYIDVSFNTNLASLSLNNNNLNEIDLVPLINLENVSLYGNNLTAIDVTQNVNLTQLTLGENNLSEINISNNLGLTSLDLGYNNIASIDVRQHGLIEFLDLEFNDFTFIDVTQNANLTHLLLTNNQLTSIDISQNTDLQVLELDENELTEIDLSAQTNLWLFYINDNQITELDISNSFVPPGPGIFRYFNAQNNPGLSCIQVDDVAEAQAEVNWTKDATTNYSENCGEQPFTITSSISGDVTGTAPNYTVTEGQSFNLNFNADSSAPNGTNYTPSISISQAGVPDASGDFSIEGIYQPLTVSANNPDGSIQFTPKDDGNDTGDEVYTITITSENTNLYTITEPVSFTVRVTDYSVDKIPVRISFDENKITFDGTDYRISEQETSFEFEIEILGTTSNLNQEFISKINYTGTTLDSDDFRAFNDTFTVKKNTEGPDFVERINLYEDDLISELNDILVLTFDPPSNPNFKWENANALGEAIFTIRVIDDETFSETPLNTVFATTNLTPVENPPYFLPNTNSFSYPENASENIKISFVSDDLSVSPLTEYQIEIYTSDGSAKAGSDYIALNEIRTISVSDSQEQLIEIDIIDDNEMEFGLYPEFFNLGIKTITPGVRIKTINGVVLEEDVDYSVEIQIIDDDNFSEPFVIETSFSDNVSNVNGILGVKEGEDFEIYFNALNPANENYKYTIQYDISESDVTNEEDIILPNSPIEIFVANEYDPDKTLLFSVIDDGVNDPDEVLKINFRPDAEGIYTWEGAKENGVLEFTINILEDTSSQEQIVVNFDNSGGIEGDSETFTISLTDLQGNPYINSTDEAIEFSIQFKNELDFDLIPGTSQFSDGVIADEGSYLPISGSLNGAKISIPPNESQGSYTVTYPADNDDQREFYTAEISPLSDTDIYELRPSKIQAIILDEQGKFYVSIFPEPGGHLKLLPNAGEFNHTCCAAFAAEEGKRIEIYLDVEKGVPDSEDSENPSFFVDFFFSGDAKENIDYITTDDNNTIEVVVNASEPMFDNRLLIDLIDDGIPNERTRLDTDGNPVTELVGEKFSVNFTSQSPNLVINGNIEEALPRSIFDIRIVDVLSINSIEPVINKKTAQEAGQVPAEFKIILNEPNASGTAININYQILLEENFANPLNDYSIDRLNLNTNQGTIIIPNGSQEGFLTVLPENDSRFELDETVTLQILPGNGYSFSETLKSQIVIESDDTAEYNVSIFSDDIRAVESATNKDDAKVTFKINEPPITDITVEFSTSALEPSETKEGMEEDYIVLGSDQETVMLDLIKKVVIPAGKTSVDAYIRAIDDTELENTEKVGVTLENGTNYAPTTNNNLIIELISDEIDASTVDLSKIDVRSKSPTCVGSDQKGSIYIENNTGFEFNVLFKPQEQVDFNEEVFILNKNSVTGENYVEIPNLPLNKYEVQLAFSENNANVPSDFLLPTYIISINELAPIEALEQQMDIHKKTLELSVQGTDYYLVENNGKRYDYSFKSIGKNILDIPLNQGINEIVIKGKAACMGELKTNILFNQLMAYPNPTTGLVTIKGLNLGAKYDLSIIDAEGKKVNSQTFVCENEDQSFNLDQFQAGVYHMVLTLNNVVNNIKIIKR